MPSRKTGLVDTLNSSFNGFVNNVDFAVASILTLILLITLKDRISHELTTLFVFLLSAILIQLAVHDVLISVLGAFLVATVYNVRKVSEETFETFKQENVKLGAIVEKLESGKDKLDGERFVSDADMEAFLQEELGDDDSNDAKTRRENLKADKMSPGEAQRELFKLIDVGSQLQEHMKQMVPGLKKAGKVMQMLKGMKNV